MATSTDLYFNEIFGIQENLLEDYGAFNISLVVDLPLFIDPFLLFQSKNATYQQLHGEIITYLRYLRGEASTALKNEARLRHLYCFPEVTQNWLGFTLDGNRGRGLGLDFANALAENLEGIFENFGDEQITRAGMNGVKSQDLTFAT